MIWFTLELVFMPLLLLVSMAVALEIGIRLRRKHGEGQSDMEGLGVVDGAVFGLMGLLLAFAFSGAAQRFDERRALVTDEANFIGTAWLRLDLLPAQDQPALRQLFRDYTDLRIGTYHHMTDEPRVRASLKKAAEMQAQIWQLAVAGAAKTPTTLAGMLVLPSLNDMFDIVTTRTGALMKHPPYAVFMLLMLVLVLCSLLAGYRMGNSAHWSKLHRLVFILIVTFTYYFIVDLEHPRVGLIRVDEIDQLLVQVRASMN